MGDATNYIFAGIWWSKDLPYPQAKRFVEDYKTFTGREPDSWYPATAYDATRALGAAIEKAGSLNRTAIRDALRSTDLKDSLLPGQVLRFGKNGQVNTPFVIVQNKPGGKTDIVFPQDAANGEAVAPKRSEEHTSELQSPCNLVCRLLLEKKKTKRPRPSSHYT